MKIITLFSHKGGVSKTTTAFNLGWKLAEMGHKTLIVDTDPQCNLTALVLDYSHIDDMDDFYKNHPLCDVYTGLQPMLEGTLTGLVPGNPYKTSNDNLFLYCGNINLSEAETQISVALTTSSAIRAIKNIPGSIGELIRLTGSKSEFEYVIVDMSPSIGALNECIFMASDYFIIPTTPDFFCAQAIKSLSTIIPRWNTEINDFRDSSVQYHFSKQPPKFLGFISQRFRPRGGMPAKSFQRWIEIIKNTGRTLVPSATPNFFIRLLYGEKLPTFIRI